MFDYCVYLRGIFIFKKARVPNNNYKQRVIVSWKAINYALLQEMLIYTSCSVVYLSVLITTCFRSLQNQTSCIRNILSGMGSCVEKSVEVALAIATSFENFLLALHHRFTCEGSLPGNSLVFHPKLF